MNPSFTTYSDFRQRYPIQFGDDALWLGSGTYGKVIKVEDQVDTDWVAIKISECRPDDAKSLRAEVELARQVPPHTNIARYDACYRLHTEMGLCDFAIMKYYADGNLADLLKSRSLSDAELRELARGILEGLKLLHRQRIVHRDFKPANILISRDNRGRLVPKIADFGLSKFVAEEDIDSSDFDLSDGRGTPAYKAPEQITGSTVSFNLDLWAFGVILYEMVTGEKPFSGGTQSSEHTQRREMENKIVSVQLPDRLNTISEPYQNMIRRCLVKDIRERVRKPDELLILLEKPTAKRSIAKPIPPSLPTEDYTDMFVPLAVPTPKIIEQKVVGSKIIQKAAVNRSPSVGKWLPWAVGTAVLLLGSYVWSNRWDNAPPKTLQTVTIAAIDPQNSHYGTEDKTVLAAPVQQATLVDKSNRVAIDRAKSEKSAPRKDEYNKPKETETKADIAAANALKKQQAQQEYEDLIRKGQAAIDNGNKKDVAINHFKTASQLAEANGLDDKSGNAAYTTYLGKADRIFDGQAYDGARRWYEVAYSLRKTNEVNQKIKECDMKVNLN